MDEVAGQETEEVVKDKDEEDEEEEEEESPFSMYRQIKKV